MNERSDMDRVLGHWLGEGPSTMPDRVVDVVADRIARQRQRPAWRLLWRTFEMNATIKIAAGVAATALVAFAAWQFLPRGDAIGGANSTPSPAASLLPLAEGPLAPGTYVTEVSGIQVTFTLPADVSGWEGGDGTFLGVPPMVDGPGGVLLAFNTVTGIPVDPCTSHLVRKPVGDAVEDLAAVWSGLPHAEIVGPTSFVVSGFRGTRFEVTIGDDLSDCEVEAISLYYAGMFARVVGAGQGVELWAIDVRGKRLVVEASWFPGSRAEDVRVLHAILDSIQFTPAG